MSQYTVAHGVSFLLDCETSWMRLGAIIPSEKEWVTMRQVLAEEEARKELMGHSNHAAWMERFLTRYNMRRS